MDTTITLNSTEGRVARLRRGLGKAGIWTLCGLAGLTYLFLAAVPIDVRAQGIMSLILVVVCLGLKRIADEGLLRIGLLLIGAFITLRYFFWRTTDTLTFFDWFSFLFMMLLYFAEVYGIIIHLLGMFVNVKPLDRPVASLPAARSDWPSVDILIPTFNESPGLLQTTLRAALQVDYPQSKVSVYLCDDGGTEQKRNDPDPVVRQAAEERHEELRELCQKLGAVYLTRERNVQAKAGNLNAALKKTQGELVLILDADHIPTRDILTVTAGWFVKDPKMFLVQTPHFFLNPDPIERNLHTFARMPSENEMFYSVIQQGLDFWNAAFFCGSAALLRRTCLEEIGGISGQTITEDAETALMLHSRGYNSAYIRKPVVAGLSPETFVGFVGQRIRWAQGMIQIFLLKNPLLQKGLSLPQRLCYFNSSFFWFFSYARFIFILAPMAFLIFGLKIYDANSEEFLVYVIPHLVASIMIADYLFGRVRWSFISELYELMQCVFTLPGILQVALKPRSPSFRVTSKGEQLDRDAVSILAWPFYLLIGLSLFALGCGVWRYQAFPEDESIVLIVMGWGILNTLLLIAAFGALLERKQRRSHARMPGSEPVLISAGGRSWTGSIADLSAGGMGVSLQEDPDTIKAGDPIEIKVFGGYDHTLNLRGSVRIKRHTPSGNFLGLQFENSTEEEIGDQIALVHGNSRRWSEFQQGREKRVGPWRSFFFLLTIGLSQAGVHFVHLLKQIRLPVPFLYPKKPKTQHAQKNIRSV